ncbi:hypothetical protein WJX73_000195 [Symbiochloris irregularis]|uniref:FAS1 domain-containing protein n=1 Tax=Symbiochloris irregularis TaxID=706552 RepID=A0AAW1NZN9_9CHLO
MSKPASKPQIGKVIFVPGVLMVGPTFARHNSGLKHNKLQPPSAGSSAAASSSSTYLSLKPTPSAPTSPSSSSSSAASSSSSASPTSPSSPASPSSSSDSGSDLLSDVFNTIEDALKAFPELSIFLKLIEEALGSKIKDVETILTLFCPTNAAFEALASTLGKTVEELLSIPIIRKIILYHILPVVEEVAEFAIGEFIQTLLSGSGIKINVVKAITTIIPTGGPPASIIEKDIKAGQAILQIISGVLIPTSEVQLML